MKIGNCVGRGFIVFVLFFFGSIGAKAQLYVEDFLGEANGAQTGTAAGTPGGTWSTTAASVHRQNVAIAGEILLAENTGTEQRWETTIDISGAAYAVISSDVWSAFVDPGDYLRLYYKVDGGSEILFYELNGGNNGADLEPATPASAIVSGNTLQVIARIRNNTTTIIFFPVNSLYGLDNVTVTRADRVYSRKSGTWTDMSTTGPGGTWSINRNGIPSCGCVPLNNAVAVIQNGHTVTLPSSQIAVGPSGTPNLAPGGVDVESGGILQYNVNGVTLGIQQGLMRVRSLGTVNSSVPGITGEQVSFNANLGGATLQVDGTMSVENLVLGTNATNLHYLSGGGTLTITEDIIINANGATLTNNRSLSFTVGDDLNFNSSGSEFNNNGSVTFTGDIIITDNADDDNVVRNASGATLKFTTLDANNAELDVLNSGTLTQTGNFTDIEDADTNFDNLATGIWTWQLTPNTGAGAYDVDVLDVLDLTTVGNTFNYDAAGAQQILPIAHHHIGLSNSGAKSANNASFSVGGNWTVGGAATFTEGTGTVTLNGSVAQTITNPAGETFYNLTVNNTYGTSPQITLNDNVNIMTTLTMSDGNIRSDASNLLIMLNASTTTIGSAASYVDGPIQYNMAANNSTTTLNFPIGKNGNYGAVSLRVRHSAVTPFSYTAEVIGSSARALNYTLASGTNRVSGLRYWDIKRGLTTSPLVTNNTSLVTTGATQAPLLTIYYVALDEVTQPANLTVVKNVNGGTAWFNIGAAASGTPTGSVTTAAPSANFVSFSHFTLANLTGGTNPLPIELLSFNATLKNNVVELKWSTASETNNDNFTIERATDVEHFESILTHDGQGTSKELNRYAVVDSSPLYGRSYYRLKQTDFDGKFTYSELKTIDYSGPEFATLTAYPNPVTDPTLKIKIEGLKEAGDVRLQILNIQGQKVFEKIIEVTAPGIITEEISRNDFPSSGLYIIKAGETLYQTKKIVIE